jgi:hypothetical protein
VGQGRGVHGLRTLVQAEVDDLRSRNGGEGEGGGDQCDELHGFVKVSEDSRMRNGGTRPEAVPALYNKSVGQSSPRTACF